MGLLPEVVGPIVASTAPWGAPRFDLAERGYLVEEYQLEGTALAYDLIDGGEHGPDGRWDAAVGAAAPYRTRILVVRPSDPATFNGTVVLNWQNVSAGYESGGVSNNDEVLNGFAWVGVSAQEVGLYGFPAGMGRRGSLGYGRPLLGHDPERYATLQHPGDRGSFEIFSQAALAVGPRRSRDIDPMGGLDVQRVIAAGASQSAMRLVAYANAVHRLDPVVGAFLLSVWEGRGPRLTDGWDAYGGVRTIVRTDLATPVLVVNSEFEVLPLAGLPIADSETFRLWEVAGTPHGVMPGTIRPDHRGVTPNPLSYGPVLHAGLRQVQRWLTEGTPPPAQPRIEFDAEPRPAIHRDERGNALGGIRLPEMEAPTHEHRGMSMGTGHPPLFGGSQRFTDDELQALYPSKRAFVARWHAAVDALVAGGTLRPEDAPAMRARAEAEAAALPVG